MEVLAIVMVLSVICIPCILLISVAIIAVMTLCSSAAVGSLFERAGVDPKKSYSPFWVVTKTTCQLFDLNKELDDLIAELRAVEDDSLPDWL